MPSEVATTQPLISDDQAADIRTFDDAVAMLAQAGMEVTSVTDYGDGFMVMEKENFVNKPFVIVDWKIVPGEKSTYGGDFAVIRLVTETGIKAIITDGSVKSGLCPQVKLLSEKGVAGGVYCERGLVVSEYDYEDAETGKRTPAKTFYLHGL